jgi:hypothetical protein
VSLARPLPAFESGAVGTPRQLRRFISQLEADYPQSALDRNALRRLGAEFVYAKRIVDERANISWLVLIRFGAVLEAELGFTREVPALYSPHTDLQIRTIDPIDQLLREHLPPERRSVTSEVVFVHAPDRRLELKLADWSSSARTLVPLVADSDTEAAAQHQLAAIRQQLWSRDPYETRDAVTGGEFFGRQRLIHALRQHVRANEPAGLFGMRKTGKTSLLKELVRIESRPADADQGAQVFVYQDLEHLPGIAGGDPVSELVPDLAERLRNTLKTAGLRTKEVADLAPTATVQSFGRALGSLLDRLGDARVVIVLDEIEHLCPPGAARTEGTSSNQKVPEFFGVCRRLVQERRGNFTLLIAGLASAAVESGELYGRPNPLFNWAHVHYVRPFEAADAAELLRTLGRRAGLEWDDDATTAAFEESGGHALLLRELGSNVLSSLRDDRRTNLIRVDEPAVNAVLPRWKRSVAGLLTEVVDHVRRYYPDEATLLDMLSEDRSSFESVVDDYPVQIAHLEELGMITNVDGAWVPSRLLEIGWALLRRGTPHDHVRGHQTPQSDRPLDQLLVSVERSDIEFKGSARVPLGETGTERDLVEEVIKSCVAFINASGGTVLVGVDDNGVVLGLTKDIKRSSNSLDVYIRWITSKMKEYIGGAASQLITIRPEYVGNQVVMRMDVRAGSTPVFAVRPVGKFAAGVLIVRNNAQSDGLLGEEMLKYIRHRWST